MNVKDPIFVFDNTPSPLSGQSREEFVAKLRAKLNKKVKAAYLFGSIARGMAGAGSDVDLILVADTSKPFVERFKDFMFLFDASFNLDLLVYTDAEFARLTTDPTPGFWRDVVRDSLRVV